MSSQAFENENSQRWQALALLAITLVLSMSTWFSASAVIPQLWEAWELSPTTAAWLTIAVQIGFVTGAIVSSVLNLSDTIAPRHVILGGTIGAATANALLEVAGGPALGIPFVLDRGPRPKKRVPQPGPRSRDCPILAVTEGMLDFSLHL